MSAAEARTFLRRTTTVDTLPEAWTFIMGEVDRFERPTIEIQAVTEYTMGEDPAPPAERYVATIHGDVEALEVRR